jgi:hypothetical protein
MREEYPVQKLERKVREWLQSQPGTVEFIEEYSHGASRLDFLVLKPFPLAIELMVLTSRNAAILKAKRFLSDRIAMAERFGTSLPYIVIVSEDSVVDTIPYADGFFFVNELGPIEKLRANVNPNKEVLRILTEGDPGEVEFSSLERLESDWSDIVSLEDISSPKRGFSTGSLAHRLQEVCVPMREKYEQGIDASGSNNLLSQSRSTRQPSNRRIGSLPWFAHPDFSRAWEHVLYAFIKEKCGGVVASVRVQSAESGGLIKRGVWTSPEGKTVLLRRLFWGPMTFGCKTRELIADAWVARATSKTRIKHQLLLVGTPETHAGANEIKYSFIKEFNQLEAAGWSIMPWDFNKAEPAFIKYLKMASND